MGTALDVCALNNVAVVADGAGGVVVFDAGDPFNPVQAAVVPTVQPATAVACANQLAVAAQGSAGIAVLDLSTLSAPRKLYDLALGGTARAVTIQGNTAFVGLENKAVVLVDVPTGLILQRLPVAERVDDLAVRGQYLFVAGATQLRSYQLRDQITLAGSVPLSFFPEGITGRRRLFLGITQALVTCYPGYDVIDVTDPSALVQLGAAQSGGPNSFKQIVANGSGLGVAAVGINPRNDGTHDLYLYDLSSPTNTAAFVTLLPTPGLAYAVSIFNGLAYVADGDSGLEVMNYLAYDAQGLAPAITLEPSFALSNPTNGIAEAGQFITLRAEVADDVQVRNVEFYLDSQRVATDGNYPFEQVVLTPLRTAGKTNFTVRAKATDTGGNVSFTPDIVVQLVADATGPYAMPRFPLAHSFPARVDTLLMSFNEALNPGSITAFGVTVVGAGADQRLGTADDTPLSGGILTYDENEQILSWKPEAALEPGLYWVQVGSPLSDLAGNVAQRTVWTFRVLGMADADQDGVPDSLEGLLGLDPLNPDTDGDGVLDGQEDPRRGRIEHAMGVGIRL
jgi:hypothetical protein